MSPIQCPTACVARRRVRSGYVVWASTMAMAMTVIGTLRAEETSATKRQADLLRPIWTAALRVHGPTNVVIGRLDGGPRFCVQGKLVGDSPTKAAVELLDDQGRPVWIDRRGADDLDYGAGAYVHWIAGKNLKEPLVAYSFVPASDQRRGGVRLVRASDAHLVVELENSSRFGNNNSVVADLDGDGAVEFVYADLQSLTCYRLPSGQASWRWDEGIRFCWSLPALGDLNRDGRPEIVFGSEYNNRDGSSSMIALDAAGHQLWRRNGFAEDLGSTPCFLADIDGDGETEILKVGLDLEHRQGQAWNHLHIFDNRGVLKSRVELGFTGLAIGDLDGDGHLDGVGLTNTRDGGHHGRREIRCLDLVTGRVKWATRVPRAYLDTNSPLVADLNGDGRLEVVVGSGNPSGYGRLPNSQPWGDLYVVDWQGHVVQRVPLAGWPVNLALCDTNDDGRGELAVVIDGQPGRLALFATRAPTRRVTWPTPFANAARSGTMGGP